MTRFPAGPRLRQARLNAGVSVEAIAVAVDRTAFTISGYERGLIEPPIHILAAIARELGVPIGDILAEAEAIGVSHG